MIPGAIVGSGIGRPMSGLSLHSFLVANRQEVLARSRSKLGGDPAATPRVPNAVVGGLALFLDQLITVLGTPPGDLAAERASVFTGAALHGAELLRNGSTVAQVVQDYGSICQGVTEVAAERHAAITADEFKLFNQYLDEAIAQAVTAYEHQRDPMVGGSNATQLGVLAHEMRNLLSTSILSFDAICRGSVGIKGTTGAMLGRSLQGMRALIDRTLAEVRLGADLRHQARDRRRADGGDRGHRDASGEGAGPRRVDRVLYAGRRRVWRSPDPGRSHREPRPQCLQVLIARRPGLDHRARDERACLDRRAGPVRRAAARTKTEDLFLPFRHDAASIRRSRARPVDQPEGRSHERRRDPRSRSPGARMRVHDRPAESAMSTAQGTPKLARPCDGFLPAARRASHRCPAHDERDSAEAASGHAGPPEAPSRPAGGASAFRVRMLEPRSCSRS